MVAGLMPRWTLSMKMVAPEGVVVTESDPGIAVAAGRTVTDAADGAVVVTWVIWLPDPPSWIPLPI
jgi:hypothetical protein